MENNGATHLISVIVTVYNREKFLNKCIDSILSQKEVPLELILVDDGSTDSSLSICRSYEEQYPNVRVFHQENAGISKARNVGLDNARGDFICFHDDDDVLTPGGLKVLYDAMTSYDVDIAVGNFERLGEDGSIYSPSYMPENVKNKIISVSEYWEASFDRDGYFIFIVNWAKLYRRKIWENLRFPEEYLRAEDEYVMADILRQSKSIYVTDYIVHQQTITATSIVRSGFNIKTLRAPESKLVTTSKLLSDEQYKYAVKKWGIACGEILVMAKKADTAEIRAGIDHLFKWSCELGKQLFRYMDLKKKIKFIGYRIVYPFARIKG